MATFVKDPDAVLDYQVDWSDWLTAVEDTIDASTWDAPEGITVDDDSHDDTTATVWLSGGEAGSNYRLTNRITTAGGRTDDRSMTIQVRER